MPYTPFGAAPTVTRQDPRAQPGAYLSHCGTHLFEVLCVEKDGTVWLENCRTLYKQRLTVPQLAAYRLVRKAPCSAPDRPPDDLQAA